MPESHKHSTKKDHVMLGLAYETCYKKFEKHCISVYVSELVFTQIKIQWQRKGGGLKEILTWCSVSVGRLCTECRWGACWRQKARLPLPPPMSELSESDQRLPSCWTLNQQEHNRNTVWCFVRSCCCLFVFLSFSLKGGQRVSPLTMLFLMVTSGHTATQECKSRQKYCCMLGFYSKTVCTH